MYGRPSPIIPTKTVSCYNDNCYSNNTTTSPEVSAGVQQVHYGHLAKPAGYRPPGRAYADEPQTVNESSAVNLRVDPSPTHSKRELRVIIIALTVTLLFSALDQSVVTTALPRMAGELGGLQHISWIVTAFMLSATISTPLYGKLSDMYGRRAILIFCICLGIVASLLCGFAQSMAQLILARGLQGLGAGGLLILVQTVIGDLVPPRERGRYLGVTTGALTIGYVSGPIIGGWLTEAFSWRWVFFVNLPVGAIALVLIIKALKSQSSHRQHSLDYLGTALLAAGSISALLLLSWGGSNIAWVSFESAGLAVGSTLSLAFFYWWEKRAREPLVDFALFRTPDLLTASLTSGLTAFAMQAMLVFIPLYLQLVCGLSPIEAGLVTLPQVATMLISSLLFGPISSRYGRPKLTLIGGTLFQIAALIGLIAAGVTDAPLLYMIIALGVYGLGQGVAMPSATLIVQAGSNPGQLGMATSAIAFIRSLGGSTGVAVSGGVMASVLAVQLARLPVDAASVEKGGLTTIASLAAPVRLGVIDAYRDAIVMSFAISLLMMVLALCLGATLRNHVMADH